MIETLLIIIRLLQFFTEAYSTSVAFLFWILAGFLSAFLDSISTEIAYRKTVFYKWDWPAWFWCKEIAANEMGFIPFTKYRPCAWHIGKSLQIICFALWGHFYNGPLTILGVLMVCFLLWTAPFNFFFNWVFKSGSLSEKFKYAFK